MSFERQASQWLRRCNIPVLTHTVGQTVLERPIETVGVRQTGADSYAVDIVYRSVCVQLTEKVEDFRYRQLPEEYHMYTINTATLKRNPIPKRT